MPDLANHLTQRVLRAALLSEARYEDDLLDASYPPLGFGLDPATTVDVQVSYLLFFLEHATEMAEAALLFADDESRQLMYSLILFRVVGYRRARVSVDHDGFRSSRDQCAGVSQTPSILEFPGSPQFLRFEVPVGERSLKLDCLRANLLYTFFLKQYYFSRNEIVIQPEPGDIVVDGGGCFGDTALAFADSVGPTGHVHSFEVLSSHLEIFRHNIQQNPETRNVTLHAFALADHDEAGEISIGVPNPGFSLSSSADRISMYSLDSLVENGTIPRVDFLKMDIEGSEMSALRGAIKTIQKFRPKLAISIYHKWEDYFSIPQFIQSMGCSYQMYLANYTEIDGETVLYAICPDRGKFARHEGESDRSVTPSELSVTATPPIDDALKALS